MTELIDALLRLGAELVHRGADKLEADRIERQRQLAELAASIAKINGSPAAPTP